MAPFFKLKVVLQNKKTQQQCTCHLPDVNEECECERERINTRMYPVDITDLQTPRDSFESLIWLLFLGRTVMSAKSRQIQLFFSVPFTSGSLRIELSWPCHKLLMQLLANVPCNVIYTLILDLEFVPKCKFFPPVPTITAFFGLGPNVTKAHWAQYIYVSMVNNNRPILHVLLTLGTFSLLWHLKISSLCRGKHHNICKITDDLDDLSSFFICTESHATFTSRISRTSCTATHK